MARAQQVVAADGVDARRKPVAGAMRWDGKVWTRRIGKRWSHAAYSLHPDRLRVSTPFDEQPRLDDAGRSRALTLDVEDQVATNRATVVFDGPSGVVLAYRRPVTHSAHALLTIFSVGVWAPFWLASALGRREDRVRLEVDRWGNVWAKPLAGA